MCVRGRCRLCFSTTMMMLATSLASTFARSLLIGLRLGVLSIPMLPARAWSLSLPRALRWAALPFPIVGILCLSTVRRMPCGSQRPAILEVPVHANFPMLATTRTKDIVPLDHAPAVEAFPSRCLQRRHLCCNATNKHWILGMVKVQRLFDAEQLQMIQDLNATAVQKETKSCSCPCSSRSAPLSRQSRDPQCSGRCPQQGSKPGAGRTVLPDTYTKAT